MPFLLTLSRLVVRDEVEVGYEIEAAGDKLKAPPSPVGA
jgi:hypothetical protein